MSLAGGAAYCDGPCQVFRFFNGVVNVHALYHSPTFSRYRPTGKAPVTSIGCNHAGSWGCPIVIFVKSVKDVVKQLSLKVRRFTVAEDEPL